MIDILRAEGLHLEDQDGVPYESEAERDLLLENQEYKDRVWQRYLECNGEYDTSVQIREHFKQIDRMIL